MIKKIGAALAGLVLAGTLAGAAAAPDTPAPACPEYVSSLIAVHACEGVAVHVKHTDPDSEARMVLAALGTPATSLMPRVAKRVFCFEIATLTAAGRHGFSRMQAIHNCHHNWYRARGKCYRANGTWYYTFGPWRNGTQRATVANCWTHWLAKAWYQRYRNGHYYQVWPPS